LAAGNTPLTAYLGLTQGRLLPQQSKAGDAAYVWSLGWDVPIDRIDDLAYGDYIQIKPLVTFDTTGTGLIGSQLRFRQPQSVVSGGDISAGFKIVSASSGTITGATNPPHPDPIVITTAEPHELETGQEVGIAFVTGNTAANGRFTITVISPTAFSLNGSTGNGVYAGGGKVGVGERLIVSPGLSEADVGREIVVTGGVAGGGVNNGTYRILGRLNPTNGLARQLLVKRPGAALVMESGGAITAFLKGYRWKVSLMIDTGAGLVTRSRVVQHPAQEPFYRTDLKMHIPDLGGFRDLAVRLSLIEDKPNDIYPIDFGALEVGPTISDITINSPDQATPGYPIASIWSVAPGPNPPTFEVTFSSAIDPASVTTSTMFITVGGVPLATGGFTFLAGNTKVQFTPSAALTIGQALVVHVTVGIRNTSGVPITPATWNVTVTP